MQAIDLYSAEVLPTSHRAIGIALANGASKLVGVLAAFYALSSYSGGRLETTQHYFAFAAAFSAAAVVAWLSPDVGGGCGCGCLVSCVFSVCVLGVRGSLYVCVVCVLCMCVCMCVCCVRGSVCMCVFCGCFLYVVLCMLCCVCLCVCVCARAR
jgi:hypothetical protein